MCLHRQGLSDFFKEMIKITLSKMNLYDRGQLWGYLRTEEDHKNAFRRAGFEHITLNKIDYSTIAITGKV